MNSFFKRHDITPSPALFLSVVFFRRGTERIKKSGVEGEFLHMLLVELPCYFAKDTNLVLFFYRWAYCVDQASLEHEEIHLPQPPECCCLGIFCMIFSNDQYQHLMYAFPISMAFGLDLSIPKLISENEAQSKSAGSPRTLRLLATSSLGSCKLLLCREGERSLT